MANTILKLGSQGDDVKALQRKLNYFGYGLAEDGIFGEKTDKALRSYQEKYGLDVDGIAGVNTFASLKDNLSEKTSTSNSSKTTTSTPKATTSPYAPASIIFEKPAYNEPTYTESDLVTQAREALNTQLAQKPGAYQSQWQTQLDDTINKILNREKFSYDLNGDALYQQYKDKYIQQGKMAMGDAIGQASAMTGGYGNSYAQSVGQQAYQAQLDNLNDIVPELYQMAYDKYNQEGQDLYNLYSMLGAEDDRDYGRYRDTVADYLTERDYLTGRYDAERNFDYGKFTDDRTFGYNKWFAEYDHNYNEYRDFVEDDQWEKDYALDALIGGYTVDENGNLIPTATPEDSTTATPEDSTEVDEVDLFADFDGSDWQAYFANIRQTDGRGAAEAEMNRLIKEGILPDNMTSYASIGVRGSLGH